MKKGQYDDIIELPHPVSKKHPRMLRKNRAAQFSPFAALNGHADLIKETERQTERKRDLDEYEKEKINEKLLCIQCSEKKHSLVTICYFREDLKKAGGEYITVRDFVQKIDPYRRVLILKNKTIIPMEDILDIRWD